MDPEHAKPLHRTAATSSGAARLEFSRLKKLTGATDGNLGAYIESLAKAGYAAVDKAFVGKSRRPRPPRPRPAAAPLQEIIAGKQG